MRTFKLWNQLKTASFDLSSGSSKVTDVDGLGSSFSYNVNQASQRKYVSNRKLTYQNIAMTIIFGIGSNAYTDFTSFMAFLGTWINGLVLEYTVNGRTVFADVALKEAPKSQKTNYNVLQEKFVFERITPWYELITASGNRITINNNHFLPIEPIVTFQKTVYSEELSYFLDVTPTGLFTAVFELEIFQSLDLGQKLIIDSEKKTIIFNDIASDTFVNAYTMVNHEGYAFPVIETGSYDIHEKIESIPIHVVYKKWVTD